MSFNTYLKLTGSEQGLISAGCSSFDSIGNRHQNDHDDEIQILSLNHAITREQHCTHHP
ncbi:type VI secretion system tube protein TssD, partial [Yersinia pestis]